MSGRLDMEGAVGALLAGSVVAVPTDTVYGVAASLNHPEALAALFVLKDRPDDVALPVLIASADDIAKLDVSFVERAQLLATEFWPGPLTIVVPADATFAQSVHSTRNVVGLRVPNDETVRTLLRHTGPLAVTSANTHGHPPCTSADAVLTSFVGRDELAGVLDEGLRNGEVSTVVDVSGDDVVILRHGAVSEFDIARVLNEA